MSDKVPMTAQGYSDLEEELRYLKTTARPEVIRAIAEAREHGDLSENAEYHAARERQSFIEGRVIELEDKIARAEVIDVTTLDGDTVKFGATVTLVDEDTDAEAAYRRTLVLNATDSYALYNLGTVLKSTNRAAEAVEVWQQLLKLHPEHERAGEVSAWLDTRD